MANETPHEKAVREDREKQAQKRAGKDKPEPGSLASIRKALGLIFGRGIATGAPIGAAAEQTRKAGFK